MMTFHPTKDVMKSGNVFSEIIHELLELVPSISQFQSCTKAWYSQYHSKVSAIPKRDTDDTKARYRQYQSVILTVPKRGTRIGIRRWFQEVHLTSYKYIS